MSALSSASTSRRWARGEARSPSVASCPLDVKVVPHGSKTPSQDTEKPVDLETGFTQKLKSSRQPRRQSASSFRVQLWRIVLSGGGLWFVFMLVLDPPFAMYWMLVNVLIVVTSYTYSQHHNRSDNSVANQQQHSDRPRPNRTNTSVCSRSKHWIVKLTVLALVVNAVVLALLRKFELCNLADLETPVIRRLDVNYDGNSANALHDRVHFFRIYNPQLRYTDDVEAIHRFVNAKQATSQPSSNDSQSQSDIQIQRYAVDKKLNTWSSDVLRYNFLLQFWRQIRDAELQQLRNDIVCLVESDIVFHEAYFTSVLREHQMQQEAQGASLELAHIQHFWGHTKLEPFNIGILCTSSQASIRTRLWVQLMRVLHSKRYRRLLYLDVLYAFVSERLVFNWDQHHGCTEYYPHCRYIHFTRPKHDGIERAKKAIAQESISASES